MTSDWTPSTPPLTAATFVSTVRQHRYVAIHFWAEWNSSDREFDEFMAPLRDEFDDRILFRSIDVDDPSLAAVMVAAPVLNVPALGIWRDGLRERIVIGLQNEASWRLILADALRPVGALSELAEAADSMPTMRHRRDR